MIIGYLSLGLGPGANSLPAERLAGRRPIVLLALLLAAAVLAASGIAAPNAHAHASLLESTPSPGARLADPPSRITMLYTEPLNERLTSIGLVEVGGSRIPATTRVTAGRRLELRPRSPLPQGAYRLQWRSVSTIDGHMREGSVGFGVGTAAAGGAIELEQGPLAGFGAARAAMRWLFYSALFFFAGGLFNAVLLGAGRRSLGGWLIPYDPEAISRPSGVDLDDLARRASRRVLRAGWLAAVAAIAVVVVETLQASGGGWRGARDFLFSGNAGASRLILVAALIAAAVAVRRQPAAAAALVAVAMVAISQGGHAAGAEPSVVAVASDWVHLVAAAIWVGGIAQLAVTWLPSLRKASLELRRAILRGVLARFGRVALPAFLVVAVTGLLSALLQLGAPQELWESGYGRVLLMKVLLVAVVASVSYVHAFRLRPYLLAKRPGAEPDHAADRLHRRLLRSEVPIAVAILAAAAVLVGFPVPPRELREAQAHTAVAACDPCPFARPQPGELGVAAPAGRLTAAAWIRRRAGELSGTVRVIDGKRQPVSVPASVVGATRQRTCGIGCWRFSAADKGAALEVTVGAAGDQRLVRLPAAWDPAGDERAMRILRRTQRAMRQLHTLRQVETVQSAAAPGARARVDFRFQAPDRMAYTTRSTASVMIGTRVWMRPAPTFGWQASSPAEMPFRFREGFRWTVFESTARLLAIRKRKHRRVAELAVVDWGYPLWYRLSVDLETGRVLRQQLLTPENRIAHRFYAFDRPVAITPPTSDGQGSDVPAG